MQRDGIGSGKLRKERREMAKLELTVIENGGLCLDILRHSPALGRYAHRIDALADLQ